MLDLFTKNPLEKGKQKSELFEIKKWKYYVTLTNSLPKCCACVRSHWFQYRT